MDAARPLVLNAGMSTRTSPWPAGFPCWTDLMAPDVDAAKEFYGSVLGWTYSRPPT